MTNIFQPCGFKLAQELKCVSVCFVKVCFYCLVRGNTVPCLSMVSYCTFVVETNSQMDCSYRGSIYRECKCL